MEYKMIRRAEFVEKAKEVVSVTLYVFAILFILLLMILVNGR